MRTFLQGCLAATAVALISHSAVAGIALSSIIIDLEPTAKPYTDIIVLNDDKTENAYVAVDLYEVVRAGMPDEQRNYVENPKDVSLLISPNKFIIPPGSRKQVRIVDIKGPGDSDRIYRATFKPVAGDIEAQSTGVKIMVAYETLILRRPSQPVYQIAASRQGDTVRFSNTGNSAVKIEAVQHCADGQSIKADNCSKLGAQRLYVGNQWQLISPVGGEIFYQQVSPNKRESKSLR
jgi:P pilus assembly chaperone PapD